MSEAMHHCEVCHKQYADSVLIAVKGIAYLKWERVFPWYICRECAEKISDALLVKVVKDVELRQYIIDAQEREKA